MMVEDKADIKNNRKKQERGACVADFRFKGVSQGTGFT